MKKSVILLIVACGVIVGAVIYLNRPKTATTQAPTPVAESTATPTEPPTEKILVAKPEVPAPATNIAVPAPVAAPVVADTNAAPENPIGKATDALLAAHGQKHAMLEELRKNGQLDAVIAELQKRAAANSTDPEIPTTLGEAMLNKVKALHDSGTADTTDMGILALQADQNFNAALKIDPQNWEAQFVKYSSMTYWPSSPERDAQVAQQLSSLIDQQDGMQSQPGFAQTYVVLGNQYQKMGKPDEAMATWQLGAQKFPSDPTLQQKVSGK